MNRKIETCSLAIISKLPQICKPNEFMVAYFIINTMAIEKNDRVKMYRGELADLCNMSERNISRITESLNQSSIITKDLIGDAEKKKTYNYYRLNWQKIEEILANLDNEDGTFLSGLSGLKKERIEESKNKRIEEIKENKKRLFKTKCEQLESSTAEDENCSIDDFDYSSMDKDFLRECETATEQNLIPIDENKKVLEPKIEILPWEPVALSKMGYKHLFNY